MAVRVLGITVQCDRSLPGEVVVDDDGADFVVVRARHAAESHSLDWVGTSDWPRVAFAGGRTTLWFDDDAAFVVDRGGRRVEYTTFGDLDDRTFAHEVIDAVLPRAIALSGAAVLHGGAVAGDGGAVVLVGPSGSGKSTLAAALASRGWRLLGDDAAVITVVNGVDHVVPSGTSLRLYEDAASIALGLPVMGPPMAHWSQKRLVSPSENNLVVSCELQPLAVVELTDGAGGPSLTLLDGGATFELLARNSFDLPSDGPTAGIDLLDRWAPMSGRVEAYRLSRRLDFAELPMACALLEPLLAGER